MRNPEDDLAIVEALLGSGPVSVRLRGTPWSLISLAEVRRWVVSQSPLCLFDTEGQTTAVVILQSNLAKSFAQNLNARLEPLASWNSNHKAPETQWICNTDSSTRVLGNKQMDRLENKVLELI